jgi:hypothetical protein
MEIVMKVSKRLPIGIQDIINRFQDMNFHVNLNHDTKVGVTRLKIEHNDKPIRVEGYSFCSDGDNFDRATGTKIAFGRAMRELTTWIGRDAVKAILK